MTGSSWEKRWKTIEIAKTSFYLKLSQGRWCKTTPNYGNQMHKTQRQSLYPRCSAVKQRGRRILPQNPSQKGPKWCPVPPTGASGKSALKIGHFLRRNCWMIFGGPFLSWPPLLTAEIFAIHYIMNTLRLVFRIEHVTIQRAPNPHPPEFAQPRLRGAKCHRSNTHTHTKQFVASHLSNTSQIGTNTQICTLSLGMTAV